MAKKKFGDLFSEKLFLSQICYLGDIKEFSIELVRGKITPRQLQFFFEKAVKNIV